MTDTTELNKKESSTIAAYILKGGSTASATDRDAGFCSGGDEDDLEIEDDIHSPTDVSEDSVEVKVTPISSRNKNKRKCAEPRKVPNDEILVASGPLKKRIRFEMKQQETATERKKSFFEAMKKETSSVIVKQETNYFTEQRNLDPSGKQSHDFYHLKQQQEERILQSPNSEIKHERSSTGRSSPFRPWSLPTRPVSSEPSPPPTNFHPVYGYQPIPIIQQDEPLSLVKTKPEFPRQQQPQLQRRNHEDQVPEGMIIRPKEFAKIPIKIEPPRVPPHPAVRPSTAQEIEELTRPPKTSPGFTVESLLSAKASTSSSSQHASPSGSCSLKGDKAADSKKEQHKDHQKEQRNYKNMTRERRIEANARERTRVHTISAAFDTLRKSIPAYSHNQKLSKLSVLRIACSYILTLSRVAGSDYSADQSEPSLADCVDLVSRTIQTEGKLRKKER